MNRRNFVIGTVTLGSLTAFGVVGLTNHSEATEQIKHRPVEEGGEGLVAVSMAVYTTSFLSSEPLKMFLFVAMVYDTETNARNGYDVMRDFKYRMKETANKDDKVSLITDYEHVDAPKVGDMRDAATMHIFETVKDNGNYSFIAATQGTVLQYWTAIDAGDTYLTEDLMQIVSDTMHFDVDVSSDDSLWDLTPYETDLPSGYSLFTSDLQRK